MAHMGITNRSWDSAVVATPSDTVLEPTGPFSAFMIWNVGTVSFVDEAGTSIPASGTLPVGTWVFVKGVRINATGTSATVLLVRAPA